MRYCFASVAFVAAVLVASATHADQADDIREVSELVQPYIDAKIFTGVSIGVVRKDREPLIVGFGRTGNPQQPRPDGQTVYEIGSISKVFTGILFGGAVAAGEVKLQQPVEELLPGVFGVPRGGLEITLLDLATHASGLPRLPSNMDPAAADPYADYDAAKLLEFLARDDVLVTPHAKTEYSNLGFALLGHALERHLDRSYEQLLRDRIAQPLEMQDTTSDSLIVDSKRLALPHDVELRTTNPWTFKSFAAAGAIRSTVDDMVRFIQANLQPPEGKLGAAIDLAFEVHRPSRSAEEFAMGLGWHIARDGNTRWHNGQTGGYHSAVFINRRSGAGVVVLSNTATMEVDVLAEQLAVWAMGGEAEPREFARTAEVSDAVKQLHAGRYRHTSGAELMISVGEDGQLMAQLTGQPAFAVYPESDQKWNYRVVQASLLFDMKKGEPSKSLTLLQNGMKLRFDRVAGEGGK